MKRKILVAFFSRAEENYNVGYIEKGNTEITAEIIARLTGADLFRIETTTPYPSDYRSCTETADREKNGNARPEIKKRRPNRKLRHRLHRLPYLVGGYANGRIYIHRTTRLARQNRHPLLYTRRQRPLRYGKKHSVGMQGRYNTKRHSHTGNHSATLRKPD